MKRTLKQSILIGSMMTVPYLSSPFLTLAQTASDASVVSGDSHMDSVISWFNPLLWFKHDASDPVLSAPPTSAITSSDSVVLDPLLPLAPEAGGELDTGLIQATIPTTTPKVTTNKGTSYSVSVNHHTVIPGTKADEGLLTNGPKTMVVGEQGIWNLVGGAVADPDSTYSVDWGDIAPMEAMALMPSLPAFTPSHTFEHSYDDPGTYLITFTAMDATGISTTTSASVRVNAEAK